MDAVSFYFWSVECFCRDSRLKFVKRLLSLFRSSCDFFPFILIIQCITLTDCHMLNHLCAPGINLMWSQCILLLFCFFFLGGGGNLKTCFLFFNNDFHFFHYSWFTVLCQFSTAWQGDPVTHTCIQSFFLHLLCSKARDQTSQCYTAGSHCILLLIRC